jgi:hypothetical protein
MATHLRQLFHLELTQPLDLLARLVLHLCSLATLLMYLPQLVLASHSEKYLAVLTAIKVD